jgi:hypothetical protein
MSKYGKTQDGSRYQIIWKETENRRQRRLEILSLDLYKNRNNVKKGWSMVNT